MAEPKARKRRTPKPETYSFTVALEKAEKLLEQRMAAKDEALEGVAILNIEIAGLRATINALKNQLNPGAVALSTAVAYAPGHDRPWTAEKLGLVREIPEGAGSILIGPGEPPQQTAPDLDELPGMDGEFK